MVFTYSMLYDAWKKTVVQSSNEPNRAKYKYYLEDHIHYIISSIEDMTFTPKPMRNKTIYFPKKRNVQVPTIDDKIVQHAICDNYLYERVTKPLIKETSACLIGRGDGYASKIMTGNLRRYYAQNGSEFYALKCDIHHYFATIDHEKIVPLIERYVDDEVVKWIMWKYIDMMPKGLALGLQQSQLLANLFLSGLDHMIKEELGAKFYGRHMDDFYILSGSKEYLYGCLSRITEYLNGIGLELNPKTAVFSNAISFLGFTYSMTDKGRVVKRLDKGKRNTKRKQLKKKISELKDGKLSTDKFADSYQGWRSHALNGDCAALVHAWDEWIKADLSGAGYNMVIKGNRIVIGRK